MHQDKFQHYLFRNIISTSFSLHFKPVSRFYVIDKSFSEIHSPNTSVSLRCRFLFWATWNDSPEFGYIKELLWSCSSSWMKSKNMAIEIVIHFGLHSLHFTVSCTKHRLWIACKCSSVWWNNSVTPKINRWCCWCSMNCGSFFSFYRVLASFRFSLLGFLSIYIALFVCLCVCTSFYSRSKALGIEMVAF